MPKPVTFFSEGVKLAGDLYLPADLARGEKRAGIVLCHGYTGVRNIYLPDNARVLAEAGYVVLNFDYKGSSGGHCITPGLPLGLSRDLIIRGLADQLQQRAHGGPSRALQRRGPGPRPTQHGR